MRRYKKVLIIFVIIFVGVIVCSQVYADPNSSKGFAEFDDIKAAEETNELTEQQNQETTIGKSTNNYLGSLEIEGHKITPQFDKQTLLYTIQLKENEKEIKINAKPSDSKASVSGIGKIAIKEEQDEYRIDVTAESGTVRTYIIKIANYKENQEDEEKNVDEPINENLENEIEEVNVESAKENNINYSLIIIIILMLLIIYKSIKYKGKHEK